MEDEDDGRKQSRSRRKSKNDLEVVEADKGRTTAVAYTGTK